METKRFIGNDMSRLYERVRRELGRDAVIVHTRTLARDGADPLIEIVAGPPAAPSERLDLDLQRTLLDATGERLGVEPGRRRFTVEDLEAMLGETPPAPAPVLPERPAETPEWLEGFAPNAPVRRLPSFALETNDEPQDDGVRPFVQSLPRVGRRAVTAPQGGGLREALAAGGLSAGAVDAILRAAGSAPSAAEAFAQALETREIPFPAAGETAVIAVLGPTGAGRTTALMKMALDCADSGRSAVLVAADPVRMGAREQVHAFGSAAGLDVLDAFTAADLPRLSAGAAPGACLFVDLPAGPVGPTAAAGVNCYAYLALPAHWQQAAVERALLAFDGQAFDGCILTFADLATNLAPALSLVLESPLGLAFVSTGRDIAEGMAEPDLAAIAAGLFAGEGTPHGALIATA